MERAFSALHYFASYRVLCTWNNEDLDITSMSENTLRKHINNLYQGGISSFEYDRQKLLIAANSTVSKPGSKEAYKQEVKRLCVEGHDVANHILMFSAQYLDLLKRT